MAVANAEHIASLSGLVARCWRGTFAPLIQDAFACSTARHPDLATLQLHACAGQCAGQGTRCPPGQHYHNAAPVRKHCKQLPMWLHPACRRQCAARGHGAAGTGCKLWQVSAESENIKMALQISCGMLSPGISADDVERILASGIQHRCCTLCVSGTSRCSTQQLCYLQRMEAPTWACWVCRVQ